MRITLLAVGRLKTGPERELFDEYVSRFRRLGQGLGLRDLQAIELESGGGLKREGARLLSALPKGATALRLDEHGEPRCSSAFAAEIAHHRSDGTRELVFMIGGAAGYSNEVIGQVPATLAFGPQTWPHRLVRVMLAEQLYRAASILAGTPYHKA